MAALTDYLENALLDHVLRNTALASPTTVYLALFDASPTDTGAGGTEITGTGYSRQAVTFAAPVDGATSNSNQINLTNASGGAWSVAAVGIMDANSGGNMLCYGTLTGGTRTVDDGDTLTFNAGDIDITLA